MRSEERGWQGQVSLTEDLGDDAMPCESTCEAARSCRDQARRLMITLMEEGCTPHSSTFSLMPGWSAVQKR